MIRHHHPCLSSVVAPVTLKQDSFDDLGDIPPAKPPFALPSIQPRLQCAALHGMISGMKNGLQLRATCGRKGIVKLKRHKLCYTWCIKMWQVSALMPAAKSHLQLFSGRLPTPLALGADEF